MREARYSGVLHLCCAVALVCYATAAVSWPVFALGLVGIAFGWRLTGRRGGRPISRLAVNVLLAVAGLSLAPRLIDGLNVADFALVVVVLLCLKLLDRRAPRDDAQVLVLVAFLCIAAVLTSNSLWVGFGLLVTGPLLLWTVFSFHVARTEWLSGTGGERVRSVAAGRAVPVVREQAGGESGVGRSLVGLAGGVWLLAAVAGVGFFLVAPRNLAQDTFGDWGRGEVGKVTGFNDEIELGAGGLLSESQEIVLDLVVIDGNGQRRGGDLEAHYLRGAVLTEYADGRWQGEDIGGRRRSTGSEVEEEWVRVMPGEVGGTELIQRITLRNTAGRRGPLFSVWRPVDIRSQDRLLVAARRNGVLERTGRGGKLSYEVRSVVDEPAVSGVPRLIASFDSQVVAAEVAQVLEAGGVPADPFVRSDEQTFSAIRLIEDHLRRTCRYTTVILPAEGDPVDWFLSESREGHCEYFASAMAAMCRSVGIGARVVTGYVAAEWNSTTAHYTVRESDAHAWVEAEARPGVWRTFDPTPPSEFGAIHQPRIGVVDRLRRLVDAAEFAWINAVVGYKGPSTEEADGGGALLSMSRFAGRLNEYFSTRDGVTDDGRVALGASAAVIAAGVFVAGVGGLLLLAFLLSRLLRGRDPRRIGPRYYRRVLAQWKRRGLGKPEHVPPLTHLGQIQGVDGVDAAMARTLIDRYYRERFGRSAS